MMMLNNFMFNILYFSFFAGTPPIVAPDSTSRITTALAPITTSFPILISPSTFAPQVIITLFPI